MSGLRIGVDIGGTFTDCLLEESGQLSWVKIPTTSEAPEEAAIKAFNTVLDQADNKAKDVDIFIHGTTLALNTLLERRGSTCGMLVTRGFRDVLELGRLRLPTINDYLAKRPKPLLSRRCVIEINERLYASGDIHTPINESEVLKAAEILLAEGVESIVICFLHAYRNPIHEEIATQLIREKFPDILVWASSEIWPEQGEYERFVTTSINAYIGLRTKRYIKSLDHLVREIGFKGELLLTKSNGGVMRASSATELPVAMLLSGPAAGVVGACRIAKRSGLKRVITFDMGGTSSDISVFNENIAYTFDTEVANLPLLMPVVDIYSIGAGGGSIARLDSLGVMKVGPQSAGSDPGPACYGLGGKNPTITDAYVAAGIISPDTFLGGKMRIDPLEAHRSLELELKGPSVEMACYVLDIATATMYSKFTPYLARLGVDPKDYVLLAYGGAGPTHAFLLARELGIPKVLIPPRPGLLCAFGCLVADLRTDYIATIATKMDDSASKKLLDAVARLKAQAMEDELIGSAGTDGIYSWSGDMRYCGQTATVSVPLTAASIEDPGEIVNQFHHRYRELHGQSHVEGGVELINLRLQIVVPTEEVSEKYEGWRDSDNLTGSYHSERQIYLEGKALIAQVIWRWSLKPGMNIPGAAVIEQEDSTVFIPPGWQVQVDKSRNLIGEQI